MSSSKIGIVCSGGGMTCAYSAGALEAIHDHYGFKTPHVLVGASGSAGNCAYYTAGQSKVGKDVWVDLLTDGQMISWRQWPILNIDYLVNTVFRKRVPLDHRAVAANRLKLLIPTTNAKTGLLHYFSNHDKDFDIFSVLIAAKTVPIVAGRSVCVDGMCKHQYADGDIGQQLNHYTDLAKHYGCEQTIVIDNEAPYHLGMRALLTLYKTCSGKNMRRAVIRGLGDDSHTIQDDDKTIVLRPSQPLSMSALTDSREKVERAYDMGYADAVHNPRLQKLFL